MSFLSRQMNRVAADRAFHAWRRRLKVAHVETRLMRERLNCPVCEQSAPMLFSRPYASAEFQAFRFADGLAAALEGKNYEIRHCSGCDLCFQTWVMEAKELALWYSPALGQELYQKEIARRKLNWFAHLIEEILVFRQLSPAAVPVVLDFGCNWGKWASAALALGCEVYGVDVNRAPAEFCASRGIKILSLPQAAQLRFDFINVDQVAEHLSDPLAVICQLADALKRGGFLKLSTPGNPRMRRDLARAQVDGNNAILNPRRLDPLMPLEHVNLFSARALKLLGHKAGLRHYRLPLLKCLGAAQLWNMP